MTTNYRLAPIAPADARRLRDEHGAATGAVYIADAKPGYPCRQCLRDAEIGERLVLVAYDPFASDSPYRSRSPIFLHESDCGTPHDLTTVPAQLSVRQLSVRAFDEQAMMIDADVIEGSELDDTLRRFLTDPATTELHVHNASRGCWATTVTRTA